MPFSLVYWGVNWLSLSLRMNLFGLAVCEVDLGWRRQVVLVWMRMWTRALKRQWETMRASVLPVPQCLHPLS